MMRGIFLLFLFSSAFCYAQDELILEAGRAQYDEQELVLDGGVKIEQNGEHSFAISCDNCRINLDSAKKATGQLCDRVKYLQGEKNVLMDEKGGFKTAGDYCYFDRSVK